MMRTQAGTLMIDDWPRECKRRLHEQAVALRAREKPLVEFQECRYRSRHRGRA